MAGGGFRLGEAFLEIGAKVNEKALTTVTEKITSHLTSGISRVVSEEMDQITSLGHTTGTKTAVAMQTGFAATGVWMFGDIEKGLAEVNTLSGKTGQEGHENMEFLRQGVYELSREMGISQKDVIPGMYDAISAGVPTENIFDFMRTSSQLAVAGATDTGVAVDGLTTILNAFGMDADEAGNVADMMFTTVKNGKTTIDELASSMFQVAPIANAANVGLDEVNAAMGTLTLSGTPTSVAATQVRSAIQGLLRPSEDMTAIMNAAGYESAQAAIDQEGLAGALQIVADAAGNDVGEMSKLLGSIEATQAATGILSDGQAEYSRQLEEQANATGAATDAYDMMNETQNKGMQNLKVAWENFAVVIGEALAPAFNKLADILNSVMGWFSSLPKPVQQAIGAFTLLATVLGPPILMFYKYYKIWKLIQGLAMARNVAGMTTAVKGFSPVMSGLVTRITGAGKAIKAFNILKFGSSVKAGALSVAATLKGGFASALAGAKGAAVAAFSGMKTAAMGAWSIIMAHPFIAIGVAIAAIVVLIIANWDTVKEWFLKFWNWFKSTFVFDWLVTAFNAVKDVALAVWNGIKTAAETAWNVIKTVVGTAIEVIKTIFLNFTALGLIIKHWDTIKEATMTVFNFLKEFFTTIFNVYKTIFETVFGAIQTVVTTVFNVIKTVAETIFNAIKTYFETVFNIYKKIITTVWDAISGFLEKTWNFIKDIATKVFDAIKDYFTKVFNFYKDLITDIWNAVTEFLTKAWNGIKDTAVKVFNAIKDHFEKVFNFYKTLIINVWNAITDFLSKTWNTIKEIATTVFNAIKDFFTQVFNFYKDLIINVWNAIKDFLSKTWNGIKAVAETVFNAIKAVITTVFNAIKTVAETVWNAIKGFLERVWNGLKVIAETVFNGIKTVITNVFNTIKSTLETIWNTLKDVAGRVWNGIKKVIIDPITEAKDWIVGKFNDVVSFVRGLGSKISSAASGMWNGITSAFKGAINTIIRGWNRIEFKIPGFKVGPIGYDGFTLGLPDIPQLAKGGWAKRAGTALVGEKGPELLHMPKGAAVQPLSGRNAPSGDSGMYINQVIIDAKSIKDMNDIADFFDKVRQEARTKPKGRESWLA